MFKTGQKQLAPYLTVLDRFCPGHANILVINNSMTPFGQGGWQGVLHTATIPHPDESKRRIINSTMIAPRSPSEPDWISPDEIADFLTTAQVRRQGYDKPHLRDD